MINQIIQTDDGPIAVIDERDQTLMVMSGSTIPCPCCGQDLGVKTTRELAVEQGKRIGEIAISEAWDKVMVPK